LRDAPRERLERLFVVDAAPLALAEPVGHARGGLGRGVDDDRDKERLVVGHIEHATHGQVPLAAEISFFARVGVGRNERHE
jgi:hypothetical protein